MKNKNILIIYENFYIEIYPECINSTTYKVFIFTTKNIGLIVAQCSIIYKIAIDIHLTLKLSLFKSSLSWVQSVFTCITVIIYENNLTNRLCSFYKPIYFLNV